MLDITRTSFPLLIPVVFGLLCAMIASGRGRNPLGWFVIGLFLPCIGIVVLLVIPDLKLDESRHGRLQTENRRLREQARKERQTAERRHAATQRRIDVHDRALDVDTASMVEAVDVEELAPPPPRQPNSEERETLERALWFYLTDRDEQIGPMPFAELRRVWRDGRIGAATYVWREGMGDWRPLREVPGLEGEFRA